MTIATKHYPHALILPGSPNKEIVQFESASPNEELTELIAHASGDPLPSFVGFMNAKPGFTFSSTQLKTLLDELSAAAVVKSYIGSNLDIEMREGTIGGARIAIATTTHLRGRCGNAVLVWESLSAQHDGQASLSGRVVMLSADGTTKPLTWTNAVAVTGTTKVQHIYTLGPLKINGSFVGGGRSAEWNNRLTLDESASDGEPFNTWVDIEQYQPQLIYRARNAGLLATYNDPVAVTSCTLFLRKKLANGYVVPDATEEHIAITTTAGVCKARGATGDEVELLLNFTQDTGAVFAIDTTAAIA